MNPRGKKHRWGKGGPRFTKKPGRPISFRNVEEPIIKQFLPVIPSDLIEKVNKDPIFLFYDELEAVKLTDFENLNQELAGEKMQVSRGTVWRLLQRARTKIISSIIQGRPLYIVPRER